MNSTKQAGESGDHDHYAYCSEGFTQEEWTQ